MGSKFILIGLFFLSLILTASMASAESTSPVASFTANTRSGNAPLVVLFTDTGNGGAPTSWFWDFGDGITSKHAQTATHTFTDPGTYTVTLTVSNDAGSDTVTETGYITVLEAETEAPSETEESDNSEAASLISSFTSNVTSGNAPLVVLFTDTGKGSPTSWLWDFGDGITSKHAQTATHTFTEPGIYSVTLTISNDEGSNTLTKTDYIIVSSVSTPPASSDVAGPVASFTANTRSGNAPLVVLFTDTSSGEAPTSWFWDFGDGIHSKHAQTATHTFTDPGTYTVTLTVSNDGGSDTKTETYYITVFAAAESPEESMTVETEEIKYTSEEQPEYTESEETDISAESQENTGAEQTTNTQVNTVNNYYNDNDQKDTVNNYYNKDTPAEEPEAPSASVSLHGEKTEVFRGEDILLRLSAVNLITKPIMHVQVIIIPPSGMTVSSSEFVQSGAGQYTTTYELKPGQGRDIEVKIESNQAGNFDVEGKVIYYFGEDIENAKYEILKLPIQVEAKLDPQPVPNSPGFGAGLVLILMAAFILKRD
jgi:PKD repeat protein